MGISAWRRPPASCARAMLMAALCLIAAMTSLAAVAAGKRPSSGEGRLASAITRIDALLSRALRRSTIYRSLGYLSIVDFGLPLIDWRMGPTLLFSKNPDAEHFKTLIQYAVCHEDTRALTALFRLNDVIYGSLFTETEIEFLHHVARRNGLELDFRGVHRRDKGIPPDDLRSINRRRDIVRFLEAGDIKTARRLIWYFHKLCASMESHIDKLPSVLPRSITTVR